jgi:hypothetical protein
VVKLTAFRIIAWARKHDRLLTVIGALVIFLTFTTKEFYRDRAKELGSSIATAQ